MEQFFEALRQACTAFIDRWNFVRHMQRGGNPDEVPF